MIKLAGIRKRFKNNKVALKDISLTLPNNGMVFICGESGSGKTTLLNIIGMLDSQTGGKYYFEDKAIHLLSNRKKDQFRNNYIGFIFQDINLIEELNIEDNILLPLHLQNKNIKDYDVDSKLDMINLNENPQDYPINLSGGERQRIAILRAIEKDSKVIIADEPTGSLDPKNANNVMELLKKVSKERLVIVVTHQIELADKYGDRIISIDKGLIIEDVVKNEITSLDLEQTIIKKTTLPIGIAIKFAFKWLSNRMFFLIISMLTSIISLAALGLAFEFLQYNDTIGFKRGIIAEDLYYMSLSKKYDSELDQYNYFSYQDEKK